MAVKFNKDWQYYKFCLYGFLKNLRLFEPFILLAFLNEKGISYPEIGALYSIRFLLRMLFEIPSGMIADALGRKFSMLFSYSFYIVSFLLYYFAGKFYLLIIPTVLFAIGDAFRTGTHKAMIFAYLKKKGWQDEKVDYYGRTRSWSQTGSAISALLAAGIVLLSNNYNNVFLYTALPYSIGFVLLASYPDYLNGEIKAGNSKRINRKGLTQVLADAIASFKKMDKIRLSLNIASYSGFYNAAKDYLQVVVSSVVVGLPLIISLNQDQAEQEVLLIGISYFAIYFVNAFASRNSGTISRLFSSNISFLNSSLLIGVLIAIGAGLLSHFMIPFLAIIFFMAVLFIQNLRRPAGVSVIANNFDDTIHASVLSVESQLGSLIAALLSLVIGFAAEYLGPGLALGMAGVLILLVFPVIYLKKKNYAD